LVQYLTILFDYVSIGPARIGVVEVQVAVLNRHGLALQTVIPFGFAQITTALGDGDFFANGLFASPVFAGDGQANIVSSGFGVLVFRVSTCSGMAIAKVPAVTVSVGLHDFELVFPIAVVLHHEITFQVACRADPYGFANLGRTGFVSVKSSQANRVIATFGYAVPRGLPNGAIAVAKIPFEVSAVASGFEKPIGSEQFVNVDLSFDVAFFGRAGVDRDFFTNHRVPLGTGVQYFQANLIGARCREFVCQRISLLGLAINFPINGRTAVSDHRPIGLCVGF
jgi:hypothetical protein